VAQAGRPAAGRGAEERKRAKLGYKEARELEELPAMLEALEGEQREVAAKLADPATYQDRSLDARALGERHARIEEELTRLLARWEELEAKK
jgi:ATP-binding cassette subfamily F protein uup